MTRLETCGLLGDVPIRPILLATLLLAPAAAQSPALIESPPASAQRLEPGDLVAVTVFNAPELATDARLDEAGSISMPEAGTVPLAGLSTQQAERALEARLAAAYLLAPTVHVNVREFAPQPVTVLGAVKLPGVYSARTYPDLGAMLAAAGGLDPGAGAAVVVTGPGSSRATMNFDLDALARNGIGSDTPLRSGDVVRVVPAATVIVGGDVLKPGAYALPASGLTLLGALSLAGGTTHDGRLSKTRIVRRGPSGASVLWVNAGDVLAGRAPDPPLEPFDLVFVPHSSAHAAFVHGLATAVGTGAAILSGLIVFH